MGLVLITHSMGVVAETAERVCVQYAGQKVEEQKVADLFRDPHHPYTAALLSALPERATGAPPAVDSGRGAGPVRPAQRAACSRRAASSPPISAAAVPMRVMRRALPLSPEERRARQPPRHKEQAA